MTMDLEVANLKAMGLIAMDAAARERALDVASFIVQAPAGAGKTELLTQRYLRLLATVDEPEEIIALTFTNKAATEMRNRILLSLEQAEQGGLESAPHKLKTRALAEAALQQSTLKGWDLIRQPSRLRILTMDALCSSLTRQMPLLSRFGGQPAVSDDADRHYLEAARLTLADIVTETQADDTVSLALAYMNNDAEKLTALLAQMLAKRDQWIKKAHQSHGLPEEDMLANTESVLRHLICEELTLVASVLSEEVQLALLPLLRFAASQLDSQATIAPFLDRQSCLKPCLEDLPLWRAMADFLLTQEKTYRKSLNKNNGFPADAEHKAKKEQCLALLVGLSQPQVVANALALPDLATLQDSQPVVRALSRLLQQAYGHLWFVFQKAGEVDFVEIAQQASWALEDEHGATDLALKLDYTIRHLLIDEFQDTSPVQIKLIEQLIAGWQPEEARTLFCVGDPMQSIYRFRKADVSLFLKTQAEGIAGFKLTPLQLSLNYRSHPKVIEWINTAFAQVFPIADAINHGAIKYSDFTASLASIEGEGVSLHPLILGAPSQEGADAETDEEGQSADLQQLEAAYVANLIAQLKAGLRPPQKIAVLVRSRNHLQALVTEIRRHHQGLHFQALEIEPLNERQTVQDALSLLCALLHRADRSHWLNVLRAPWCGLTLADLHALAGNGQRDTVWAAMHDEARLQGVSADGRLRLQHAAQVLSSAFECQGRLPLRRWLERTWLQLGGAQCLVDAGDNRDVQVFFDLVEKNDRSGQLDVASLDAAMKKLYAKPDIQADGSVQFLTIHKAKGLEFDSVILPALNRKSRADDNDLLLWEEVEVGHQSHLMAAPVHSKANPKTKNLPNLYRYIKNLEKIRGGNEVVRLLYVAATRSQRQLHLIAGMQKSKDGVLKPVANSLLAALWPTVAEAFAAAPEQMPAPSQKTGLDARQFKAKLQRLPSAAFTQASHGLAPLKLAMPAAAKPADAGNVVRADTSATGVLDLYKDCGSLAHRYMELFAKAGAQSSVSLPSLAALRAPMQRWLKRLGHNVSSSEQGANLVVAALQTTLSSEAGQWVLQAHSQAASELSLMQASENGAKNHVIDRTFVDAGTRWIIDYKLGLGDAAQSGEAAAEAHRPQLNRYASLFAAEGLPIEIAVLFLSTGRMVEL